MPPINGEQPHLAGKPPESVNGDIEGRRNFCTICSCNTCGGARRAKHSLSKVGARNLVQWATSKPTGPAQRCRMSPVAAVPATLLRSEAPLLSRNVPDVMCARIFTPTKYVSGEEGNKGIY